MQLVAKYLLVLYLFLPLNSYSTEHSNLIRIKIEYSNMVDYLMFFDQLSNSFPGITNNNLLKRFKNEKNLSNYEISLLEDYANIRKKYLKSQKFTFFSSYEPEDLINRIFFENDTKSDIFFKLSQVLSEKELLQFKKVFDEFEERISLIIKKNKFQNCIVDELNAFFKIDSVQAYIKKICNFFGVNYSDIAPKIKLAWREDSMPTKGYLVDENIIIFYNESFEPLSFDFYSLQKTLLHELVHYISKKASHNEKEKWRETFFQYYEGDTPVEESALIDEPLAVLFGNIIFTKSFYNSNYEHYSTWYINSWIRILSMLALPLAQEYLENNKKIDDLFLKKYAQLCSDTFNAPGSLIDWGKMHKEINKI